MSSVAHMLIPDIAFVLKRRIVLARLRVTLTAVIRKSAAMSAPATGVMWPARCPHNDVECRDAYMYGYRRVVSAGTMSPV